MTIRDLKPRQRIRLMAAAKRRFKERNRSKPKERPLDWYAYQEAYSDGVQQTLLIMLP